MGDIHFDMDQDTFDRAPVGSGEKADLIGWMMQKGIAKNEQQAQYALVGVVVASLILSLFFWRTSTGGNKRDGHLTTRSSAAVRGACPLELCRSNRHAALP